MRTTQTEETNIFASVSGTVLFKRLIKADAARQAMRGSGRKSSKRNKRQALRCASGIVQPVDVEQAVFEDDFATPKPLTLGLHIKAAVKNPSTRSFATS